jgi:protein TonB
MMSLPDTDREGDEPLRPAERIVDIIFAGEPAGRGRRSAIAFGTVLAVLGTVGVLTARMGPSAGPWSAEMAARIHDAIATQRTVELTPPAPPPPVARPASATASTARVPHLPLERPAPAHGRPAPAAPARAGALAAAAEAPADFTGTAFVVGNSAAYAGGTTMRSGTSRAPVAGAVAPGGTGNGATSDPGRLARPVSLDQSAWSCQWPSEADAQQIDEQTVVLRVTVRPDGRAERADIVSDPGFGFGQAARFCALATRFEPARDTAGHPMRATSPPIRVHFFR